MRLGRRAKGPERAAKAAKRVFVHVGAPKTGTTYLQNVLYANRDALAEQGVLYPYTDPGQSFRSMLDFRQATWAGSKKGQFAGEWETVAQRTREWTGDTVIISSELLGGSSPERIAVGVASLQPAEVHVIFSARDFARQLVSDWQEHIKHKHTVTLEKFLDDLVELGLDAPEPFGELFWGMHDAAHVLPLWETVVPPENIHVITVPPPGAPADTLWRRFCSVTGLAPDRYESPSTPANRSMGVAETELVRRMNAEVRGMSVEIYDTLVRRLLAEDILGGQSAKLMLPPDRMEWACERSRQLIENLQKAGYAVAGDLEELMPRPADHAGYVSPTMQTEADLGDAAIRAATGLLRHAGRQRRRILELQREIKGLDPMPPAKPPGRYQRTRRATGKLLRRLHLR
ncbi:MAG: hypothetical protein H0T14_05925 [Nocardioidaceae bacterium]|nr:hypothetical protein [Nocardioidaceae bacterium]